ncbi:nickel pincer cofactor biosynthesis protein LarC [Phytohabitans kaempferiae]|uniref:Pyridinium-3,5-bisthiocarboxylic acid mononucleotide nickel insertion protein n=1 Tax=Phytohabitans kaempferiae TaxID=1620943 RepID=A0ABV6ME72_9ACTN
MTRALWVDAGNGAAGDMLLAALLDAGASLDTVRAGLDRLGLPLTVDVTQVRRHGFRAAHVLVRAPESHVHRGLSDVLAILARLAGPARDFAVATFTRLAESEARVHGSTVDEVHFHEVGALDAIADVAGCALALHDLALLGDAMRVVSPVAVGSGTVRSAHGPLPVPAPAVADLLTTAGAPLAAHRATMELCTPTGAALLVTLATAWGPPPAMTPTSVGVGAGTADPPGHANVLRVLVGTGASTLDGAEEADLVQVEATVDDLDPRVWPDLLEELRAVGAADAWCVPALMRKGRPGQVLTVLVDAARVDLVCRTVFAQTTTLGLRLHPVRRRALRRDTLAVTVAGHEIRVKRGFLGDAPVTVQPEYDDAAAAARASGIPVAHILDAARAQALPPPEL